MLDAAMEDGVAMGHSATGVQSLAGICTSGAVAVSPYARWYAVLCRSGQEERAAQELRKQRFAVFCPLVQRSEKPRDRRAILAAIARASGKRVRGRPPKARANEPPKPVWVPAIRGYVFVLVDLVHDDWSTIRSTRGVLAGEERSAFLCMRPGEPFPIPHRQIVAMQDEVMKRGKAADLVKALLAEGEAVRIADGAFASYPGTVIEQFGDDVWLRVELFGRSTPVQLKVGQVERSTAP
jgi:transcription antitermination factor NusG